MPDPFFGGTIDLLSKSLDIRAQRHAVISGNIANAETPGYRAKDISFQDELNKAVEQGQGNLKKTHPGHLSGEGGGTLTAQPVETEGSLRNDGNNVSIDEEMSKLAQNTIGYNTSAQLIAKKFAGLKYAISEGRR